MDYRITPGIDFARNVPTLCIEFDGGEVEGTLNELVEYCLTIPEVQQLNPGSDYTQQYYNIEHYAETIIVVFRQEQL